MWKWSHSQHTKHIDTIWTSWPPAHTLNVQSVDKSQKRHIVFQEKKKTLYLYFIYTLYCSSSTKIWHQITKSTEAELLQHCLWLTDFLYINLHRSVSHSETGEFVTHRLCKCTHDCGKNRFKRLCLMHMIDTTKIYDKENNVNDSSFPVKASSACRSIKTYVRLVLASSHLTGYRFQQNQSQLRSPKRWGDLSFILREWNQ